MKDREWIVLCSAILFLWAGLEEQECISGVQGRTLRLGTPSVCGASLGADFEPSTQLSKGALMSYIDAQLGPSKQQRG